MNTVRHRIAHHLMRNIRLQDGLEISIDLTHMVPTTYYFDYEGRWFDKWMRKGHAIRYQINTMVEPSYINLFVPSAQRLLMDTLPSFGV